MTTLNKKNLNISTINSISNATINYLTLNNSIRIPISTESSNSVLANANAAILIKDINSNGSGQFYPLNVNSISSGVPNLFFNGNVVIDSSNLLSELEIELVNNNHVLDTSNIIVHGGYINFFNGSIPNSNQGGDGVGLRYSNANNTVQFKNYNTDWIDLVDITTHDQFSELIDVDVNTNPLINNQYITYNATSNLFVNSNLAIVNDTNPELGGDLYVGTNILQFSSNSSRLVYTANNTSNINNNLLVLHNNTSGVDSNYIEINNAESTFSPSIIAKSTNDLDVDLTLSTTGAGNMQLNAEQGNIYTNSDSLVVSGFVKNTIYRTSSKVGGYIPATTWNIPLSSDTILFDFSNSSQSGTYWANVGTGIDGQKLNIIYNNKSSNVISVLSNFGSNGVIIGTGYSTGLEFNTIGQSSSLVYLGDGIDAWQVLNTGSGVF